MVKIEAHEIVKGMARSGSGDVVIATRRRFKWICVDWETVLGEVYTEMFEPSDRLFVDA
jgi:hypothetical protein